MKVIRTHRTNLQASPGQNQNPTCTIHLSKGKYALVDREDYLYLSVYYWRAVKSKNCWYAKRRYTVNGKPYEVFMHRTIANTHKGMVCHHGPGGSLDNRKCNLTNMTPAQHEQLHAEKRITRKKNP